MCLHYTSYDPLSLRLKQNVAKTLTDVRIGCILILRLYKWLAKPNRLIYMFCLHLNKCVYSFLVKSDEIIN